MTTKSHLFTNLKRFLIKLSAVLPCLLSLNACSPLFCGACSSPPMAELSGRWELIRWNKAPNAYQQVRLRAIPQNESGQSVFMEFNKKDHRLNGYAGCNQFNASITEDEQGINIDGLSLTRKMCSQNSRMEFERDFTYQLKDYRSLKIEKDQLLLLGRDGDVLLFARRLHN